MPLGNTTNFLVVLDHFIDACCGACAVIGLLSRCWGAGPWLGAGRGRSYFGKVDGDWCESGMLGDWAAGSASGGEAI